MEADFLRDYDIDLRTDLQTMSWRRFRVLLNNLSPYGAVAIRTQAEEAKNKKEDEVSEEAQAKRFFQSFTHA